MHATTACVQPAHMGLGFKDTPERPRCFMVSTLASIVPAQPFVWRNYSYPPGHTSRYPGTCTADVITALRATSAAPSYFDDIVFENGRHLDGGCIANNPAAIALHEARCLFPGQPLACLVSLATGSPAPSAQAGGGGPALPRSVAVAWAADGEHFFEAHRVQTLGLALAATLPLATSPDPGH